MTITEFDEWREYHCAAFPGMETWLTKLDRTPGSNGNQLKTLEAWLRCLRTCEYEDARRGTDAMNRGEEAGVFGDHPRIIRRLCEGYVHRRTPTPNTTYRPAACETPDLHRDYAEQLADWLLLTDDERRSAAAKVFGMSFQLDRTLRPAPCPICGRKHGDGIFLMVLFDSILVQS